MAFVLLAALDVVEADAVRETLTTMTCHHSDRAVYWWSVAGRGNVIALLIGLQAVAVGVVMPNMVGILLTLVQVQPLVQPTGAGNFWPQSYQSHNPTSLY